MPAVLPANKPRLHGTVRRATGATSIHAGFRREGRPARARDDATEGRHPLSARSRFVRYLRPSVFQAFSEPDFKEF